eukprot:TRINITY_DN38945_c0_g1_i1.p1 TRINITY_DN38945_c0_g1~~TRINITY_DN38945_c0_g1_i1.p1  ORF type:complete len:123 (+),score=23.15 TRINITY_DN38945_c0_g1_i1:33-371(+)
MAAARCSLRWLSTLAIINACCAAGSSDKNSGFMPRRNEEPVITPSQISAATEPRREPGERHAYLLDDLERLVERRERAMERTGWALSVVTVLVLGSAGLSARHLSRSAVKAD